MSFNAPSGTDTVDMTDFDNFDDLLGGSNTASTPDTTPNGSERMLENPLDGSKEILDSASKRPEAPTQNQEKAKTPEELQAEKEALDALNMDNLAGDGNDDDDTDTTGSRAGRPRTDKSALTSAVKKLVDKGILAEFGDETDEEGKVIKKAKPLEEYTEAEYIELIEQNFEDKIAELREQTPKEFFESLPEEMQAAAKYINAGGKDIKGLFQVLGQVQENRELDPSKPEDQKRICRAYLQASNFGTAADIEEQINDYEEAGVLGKWAGKQKPLLDEMDKELIEAKLAQQEDAKKRQIEGRKKFVGNVHAALVGGTLGGTKIDKTLQTKLYNDLTQNNYQSMKGSPTNKLGYLMEQLHYGDKPNLDLVAQATWLLEDPDGFHKHFSTAAANAQAQETARKLKQEAAGKNATGNGTDAEPESSSSTNNRKKLTPKRNIFGR